MQPSQFKIYFNTVLENQKQLKESSLHIYNIIYMTII